MVSTVYYGSPRQAQLKAEETLPAKLDLIIEKLKIRERVKDETVAIKLHLGNNIGYSVIHPVFVRKIVQAVKDAVGNPLFVTLPGILVVLQNAAILPKYWGARSSQSVAFRGNIFMLTNENLKTSPNGK
jgi:uncharacterized Fe-S center protein